MKAKGPGLALAVGLFIVALWLALHPTGTHSRVGKRPPAIRVAVVQPQAGQTPPPASGQPSGHKLSVPPPPAMVLPSPALTNVVPPALPVPSPADEPPAAANGKALPRDARIDGNKVHLMIRDFHTLMGENPVGTNAEIMQALMGRNPKQATLGPPEGVSLNGNGELVDQWGTPYFFHQLSKDVMEIRSAGPDKIMGTADDVVIR